MEEHRKEINNMKYVCLPNDTRNSTHRITCSTICLLCCIMDCTGLTIGTVSFIWEFVPTGSDDDDTMVLLDDVADAAVTDASLVQDEDVIVDTAVATGGM